MLLSGCDNVEWGGVDFAVVPPPPKGDAVVAEADTVPETAALPTGPILYYVRITDEGNPLMIPVGEVEGDTLRPLGAEDWELYSARFIGQFLREGSEFTLFRHGARAGTFVVRDALLPEEGMCPALPRAIGALELAARGDTARPREFLAMAKAHAPDVAAPAEAPQINRGMQIVAPILAERMLRVRGAQLPGNWRAAMAQLFPFPLEEYPDPGFTATFVVGDQFGVGPWESRVAYSLFFVAIPKSQLGYDTAFVSFADFPTQGKRIVRTVDYLDWDRDGTVELLLQVMGERNPWFSAVGKVGDSWTRIFDGYCAQAAEQPVPAGAAGAEAARNSRAPAGGRRLSAPGTPMHDDDPPPRTRAAALPEDHPCAAEPSWPHSS